MQNPTETIHAAHNLAIEFSPTTWRLFNGSQLRDPSSPLIALLEAHEGCITCSPAFTKARQLPADGQLTPANVARVVVGWAPESRNWHLGLLLAAQPETNFRMRWCGLASWPSGPAGEHLPEAKLAGQLLARLIDRPFHLIPPTNEPPIARALSDTQPVQATVRMAPLDTVPEIALREPPFGFEMWSLTAVPTGYVWQRPGKWLVRAGLRALALCALTVLFLVLGIGAQTSGLATVKPNWLPWLGITVAGLLGLIAGQSAWQFLSVSDMVIDTARREVRCQRRFASQVRWRVPFNTVAYLLVSQTPPRLQGHRHQGQPTRTTQQVWLHLYDGRQFWPVVELGQVEGQCHAWDAVRQAQKQGKRRRLQLAHYDTPAHHAAIVMARTLKKDIWLDLH